MLESPNNPEFVLMKSLMCHHIFTLILYKVYTIYKQSLSINVHKTEELKFKPENFPLNYFTPDKKDGAPLTVSDDINTNYEYTYKYNLYGYTDIVGVYLIQYHIYESTESNNEKEHVSDACILIFSPIEKLDKATTDILMIEYEKYDKHSEITTPLNLNPTDILIIKRYLLGINNSIDTLDHKLTTLNNKLDTLDSKLNTLKDTQNNKLTSIAEAIKDISVS